MRFYKKHRSSGIALVITLAFVVLLTFVVVAFLSRATTERDAENTAIARIKADLVARSALEAIVGEFQQEMKTSSSTVTIAGVTGGYVLVPKDNSSMTPQRIVKSTGTVSGTNFYGLVKQSISGTGVYNGSALKAAAPAISSGTPSLNGRLVTAGRWSTPQLTSTTFLASQIPDWVVVTTNGIADPNASIGSLSTGSSHAIGRFAYNVYDEGGVLDVNIVGGMDAAQGPAQPMFMNSIEKAKNQPMLGGKQPWNTNGTSAGPLQLTGTATGWPIYGWVFLPWRNEHSAYGSVGLSDTTFKLYSDYLAWSATNGFLKPYSDLSGTGPVSDNRYVNRGDLIRSGLTINGVDTSGTMITGRWASYTQDGSAILIANSVGSTGLTPGVLPFLSTFSRDIEEPSFIPDPNRPSPDNNVNPAFPTIRVPPGSTLSTRRDGTPVAVGDALVKRFPLNKLALITGTSTGDASNSSPIWNYFGLSRASTTGTAAWTYNHGDGAHIMTLGEVQTAGREPDFFELLKAAIIKGSLGKGSSATGAGNALQQVLDTNTDYQIIQIGANIIDQYDADHFPTMISFDGRMFAGVENLPYLWGFICRPVCTNVLWSSSFALTGTVSQSLISGTATYASGTTTVTPWAGKMLLVPIMWNPHAASAVMSGTGPVSFRITAEMDPNLPNYKVQAAIRYTDGAPDETGNATLAQLSTSATSRALTLSGTYTTTAIDVGTATSGLVFSTGNPQNPPTYLEMRQPTAIAEVNMPVNSGINVYYGNTTGTCHERATTGASRNLVGIDLGDFPWMWYHGSVSGTNVPMYAFDAFDATGGKSTLRFHLAYEYSPNSNTWIEYDSQSVDNVISVPGVAGIVGNTPAIQKTRVSGCLWANTSDDLYSNKIGCSWGRWGFRSRYDPRTGRFGLPFGVPQFDQEIVANNTAAVSSGTYTTTGSFTARNVFPTNRATAATDYVLFTQDLPSVLANFVFRYTGTGLQGDYTENIKSGTSSYYYDPDGVVRPAMGSFARDLTTQAVTTNGLPMALSNSVLIGNNADSRPLILDRPFRSVAELGYVFRGTPWKQLDFSHPESGDAGLLDVFSIHELLTPNNLVAGRVNLNSLRYASVGRTLYQGTFIRSGAGTDDTSTPITLDTSSTIQQSGTASDEYKINQLVQALVDRTTGATTDTTPMRSRADLVTSSYGSSYPGYSGTAASFLNLDGKAYQITRKRESVIRALSDVANMRTWNLMIDLVAQAGRYPKSATGLNQFIVEGESRYWLHVAIDRFTGRIVDQQIEVVNQ